MRYVYVGLSSCCGSIFGVVAADTADLKLMRRALAAADTFLAQGLLVREMSRDEFHALPDWLEHAPTCSQRKPTP